MHEKQFINAEGNEKTVYEFTHREFDIVAKNLRLFGHVGKAAIIHSNDPRIGRRPRGLPYADVNERLAEILNSEASADEANTELEALRYDRVEVKRALTSPESSQLVRQRGMIYLGLVSTASAFNELRGPVMSDSSGLIAPQELHVMVDQFYEDGNQRILRAAQDEAERAN